MPSGLKRIFQNRGKQKNITHAVTNQLEDLSVEERSSLAANASASNTTPSDLPAYIASEGERQPQDVATVAAAVEVQATAIKKRPDISEQLWNDAYEELSKESPKLMLAYEAVLSKQLRESGDDREPNANDIATDITTRKAQLQRIITKGLLRTEHEAAKKKAVTASVETVDRIKGIIATGLQPSPEATLIWTALTAILPVR